MSYLLYPHGGSGNHGCEAIVRSTINFCNNQKVILFSMHPEQDIIVGLNKLCQVRSERKPINKYSFSYFKAFIRHHLLCDKNAYEKLSFYPILSQISNKDALISIGGDNYCYGVPSYIYLINKECKRKGIPMFLWGCSIEPSAINNEMLEDLQRYTHIFARESITYQALKSKGIKQVSLFPDPAFQLNRVDLPLPKGFIEGNTVGINISPLIQNYANDNEVTMKNYTHLVKHIIEHTNMQIAFIPHVIWQHNDDRLPLQTLFEQFKDTGRVCMIPDHNAEELKGFIARCRFMVVARTHASIAAYSQHIPTLVVGYSVKAKGIATDIFGTEQNYVIPVQSLREEDDLTHAFNWLVEQEDSIKKHYQEIMPTYIERIKHFSFF